VLRRVKAPDALPRIHRRGTGEEDMSNLLCCSATPRSAEMRTFLDNRAGPSVIHPLPREIRLQVLARSGQRFSRRVGERGGSHSAAVWEDIRLMASETPSSGSLRAGSLPLRTTENAVHVGAWPTSNLRAVGLISTGRDRRSPCLTCAARNRDVENVYLVCPILPSPNVRAGNGVFYSMFARRT